MILVPIRAHSLTVVVLGWIPTTSLQHEEIERATDFGDGAGESGL